MKPHERHAQILQLLRQYGFIAVADLSEQLDVSQMTIRRDLDELQEIGLLTRYHGGASLSSERGNMEWPFMLRKREHLEEKQRIGKKAASYVQHGDVVILDGGSTVLQAAEFLTQDRLTVMSNCLPTLSLLASRRNINLMGTGGTFFWDNQCFIGPIAVKAIEIINANVALMATSGLSLKNGITNRKLEEAEVKRAMIEASAKRILLMDSSKMNCHTLATVGPVELIDILITDAGLSPEDKAEIEARDVEVVIV